MQYAVPLRRKSIGTLCACCIFWQIALFKDGVVVLKAQRGVPLGLLKLIYSADSNNHGVLLGVKPRLRDSVPCLVTFDSTALNCSQYDLIVQQEQTAGPSQRENSTSHRLQSSPVGIQCTPSSDDAPGACETIAPLASSRLVQDGHESSHLGSETFHRYEPQVVPSSEGITRDVEDYSTSPASYHFRDPPKSSLTVRNPSDSGVYKTDGESFAARENNRTYCYSSPAHICASEERLEEREGNSGDDLNPAEEEIHFNPKEFDFNIDSITPLQTDKGLRWPCSRCSKDFCSSSHLKRHWILHTDFKPYKCRVCSKCFPFHWDLKKHVTKHTGNKPFKCPLCPKSFNSRKELHYHDWFHTGKKEFKCQVCQHEFTSPGNLKVHMRKHTGEKPYKCEYCPKAFHMQGHYQYHIMRHTGERPFKCDVCGKGFCFSTNLAEHKNVHRGVRPHSCPHCSKTFTHRSTLKQHVLVHEGSRPYKCHVCSKSFIQNSNYRIHLLTHKNKEDRIKKCDLCGKELLSQRGVQKHRLRCVKKTVEKVSALKTTLTFKRGHYPCQKCPRIFAYHRRLLMHESTKHKTQQVNDSRHLAGSAEQIVEPHESRLAEEGTDKPNSGRDKRLDCPFCKRTFVYDGKLEAHIQKAHAGLDLQNVTKYASSSQSEIISAASQHASVVRQQNIPDVRVATNTVKQSSEEKISVPSDVTIVYIPVESAPKSLLASVQQDNIRYSEGPFSRALVGQASNNESSTDTKTECGPLAGPKSAGPLQQSNMSPVHNRGSAKERIATGSQALSALQRLSARVGLQDVRVSLSEAPQNRVTSQTGHASQDARGSVQSEHLSALEQLSRKVGDDAGFCAVEAALNPSTQIPLRYPCLESVFSERDSLVASSQDQQCHDQL